MSFVNCFRTLAALTALAAIDCAHQQAPTADARTEPAPGQPHLAAGCLAVCQEATYIELSPKGDLCRCWAPNAFQYTFGFPDTKDKLDYSRSRWATGMQNVRKCQAQGKAWEPSHDRDQIVCLDPSSSVETDRRAADHSAAKLPESVF